MRVTVSDFPNSLSRVAIALCAVGATLGCRQTERMSDAVEDRLEQLPTLALCADSSRVSIDTLATGLDVPWDLVFTSKDRILVTEREGTIRVVENGRVEPTPWASLDVFADNSSGIEAGLMGIALAPDYDKSREIYVVGTFFRGPTSGVGRLFDRGMRRVLGVLSKSAESLFEDRVYRFVDNDGQVSSPELVIDNLPASHLHAGAALEFGPDSMLYVSVGEAYVDAEPQGINSLAGKILRYRSDGSIPTDNPFEASPVYALGFRNVQGLAWHPTGQLFATDHGPTGLPNEGGRFGRDELNVVVPGKHYGWPYASGTGSGSDFSWPIAQWTPAIAPAGLAVYSVEGTPWFGNLLVTGLRGRQLKRIVIEPDENSATGWRAGCEEQMLVNRFGRLRAIKVGPDGSVYVTTSNRDGRGRPGPHDDLLLRLEFK